jgi:hypothetical protein
VKIGGTAIESNFDRISTNVGVFVVERLVDISKEVNDEHEGSIDFGGWKGDILNPLRVVIKSIHNAASKIAVALKLEVASLGWAVESIDKMEWC